MKDWLWKDGTWVFLAICVLNAIDGIVTHWAVAKGLAEELNPIQNWLMQQLGLDAWLFFKILWVAALTLFLYSRGGWHRPLVRISCFTILAVFTLVSVWHLSNWIFVL